MSFDSFGVENLLGDVIGDFGEETAKDEDGEHDEGGATEDHAEHGDEDADAGGDVANVAAFEFDEVIAFVFYGVDDGLLGATGADGLGDGVEDVIEDGVDDGEEDGEGDGDEPEAVDAVGLEALVVEEDEEVDGGIDDDEDVADEGDNAVFLIVGHFFIPFLFYTFLFV